MEKINFENYKSPGLSKEILMQLQDNIEEAIEGIVIYTNEAGTTQDVLLDYNLENYKKIEVFYKVGENFKHEKADVKLNSFINLCLYDYLDGTLWLHTKTIKMTNTMLTVERFKEFSLKDSEQFQPYGTSTNSVKIVKVVGYK